MKKKLFIILYTASMVLAAAIIPMGIFLFSAPLWLAAVAAVLPVAISVVWAIVCKNVGAASALRTAGALLASGICLLGTYCDPYWGSCIAIYPEAPDPFNEITYEQAVEDIDVMVGTFSRVHPRFRGEPELADELRAKAVAELEKYDTITINKLYAAAETAASMLSDGHSCIYPPSDHISERYRVDYAELADEDFTITAVNGVPIEELFRRYNCLFSYEAESWGIRQLKRQLYKVSGFDYLGIPVDGLSLTFSNGSEEITRSYTNADFLPYDEYMEVNAGYYKDSGSEEGFVSYTVEEEKGIAVLTLKSCDFNDEYCDTLRKMFTEVKDKGIRNVAVDIRDNGGGNSLVANEFIRYLDTDSYKETGMLWRLGPFMLDFPSSETLNDRISELTFDGNVYILTSSSSFSSAMQFALYIKDNKLGTIIGEAPGNAASSYGDITMFELPNSHLIVQSSTKYFTRPDISDERLLVEPDYSCKAENAYDELLRITGGCE